MITSDAVRKAPFVSEPIAEWRSALAILLQEKENLLQKHAPGACNYCRDWMCWSEERWLLFYPWDSEHPRKVYRHIPELDDIVSRIVAHEATFPGWPEGCEIPFSHPSWDED